MLNNAIKAVITDKDNKVLREVTFEKSNDKLLSSTLNHVQKVVNEFLTELVGIADEIKETYESASDEFDSDCSESHKEIRIPAVKRTEQHTKFNKKVKKT